MANIKSQIKRNRQNLKRREHNRIFRGSARKALSKARVAIENGDLEAAQAATFKATKAIDKAAAKGIIHKNKAARQKSRLMKYLKTIE